MCRRNYNKRIGIFFIFGIMDTKILDTNYIHIELENGIMVGYFKGGLKMDLNIAKEVVRTRSEFFEDKSYPMLIEDKGVVSMTKEARDFFSTKEGTKKIKAGALLLNSLFSTYLGNFFLKVTNPTVPAKIFADRAKAIKWLEQYK